MSCHKQYVKPRKTNSEMTKGTLLKRKIGDKMLG